jgi:hypothetical protein
VRARDFGKLYGATSSTHIRCIILTEMVCATIILVSMKPYINSQPPAGVSFRSSTFKLMRRLRRLNHEWAELGSWMGGVRSGRVGLQKLIRFWVDLILTKEVESIY